VITPVSGKPNLLLGAYDLATLGYGAEEFFVAGKASSYDSEATADYTIRIVVLQPSDEAKFNGTAIVEWLNVSGGIDTPAVWFMAHREIAGSGYAYVAVSAQQVGIQGGASLIGADMSLKAQDPERYSRLHHPGDAFSYDIYSQVGRLIRDGAVNGLDPKTILAVGESQSAAYLTTYVNVVDPLAAVYDGFLVHSRFGPAAPLDGTGFFESEATPQAVPFRPDLRIRSSRSSPKQTSSEPRGRDITWRDSPTTRDFGRGRLPGPPTPTTTQSASTSSTTGPRHGTRSWRPTHAPTS
jgi:hypothetical protein